jgi:hypothetical protein
MSDSGLGNRNRTDPEFRAKLDSAQSDCYAQNPGRYLDTWRCMRARIAQGDMRNGPALKYMAIGDMLYANVRARKIDDATALYKLAAALTAGDI